MKLGDPTVQTGTISADVKTVQQILAGAGYNVGPIDGIFGPQTQAAVLSFQKSKGLLPDGIVGPQTWAALKGDTPPVQIVPMQPLLPQTPPPEKVAVVNAPAPSLFSGNTPLFLAGGLFGLLLLNSGKKRR